MNNKLEVYTGKVLDGNDHTRITETILKHSSLEKGEFHYFSLSGIHFTTLDDFHCDVEIEFGGHDVAYDLVVNADYPQVAIEYYNLLTNLFKSEGN